MVELLDNGRHCLSGKFVDRFEFSNGLYCVVRHVPTDLLSHMTVKSTGAPCHSQIDPAPYVWKHKSTGRRFPPSSHRRGDHVDLGFNAILAQICPRRPSPT